MGAENLRVPSSEEAREYGRKGGIASGEARRAKKRVTSWALELLNSELTGKTKQALETTYPTLEGQEINIATAMFAKQIEGAINKKDTNAFRLLMEYAKEEEKRREQDEAEKLAKLNSNYHLDLNEIPDNFHWVFRDIRKRKHREYVFEGGRGSTKSSDIAQIIIELLRNNHDVHAIVMRKVGNTLKDSVYSKLKWAIGKQGFTEEFDAKKSPLEITLKATGQKIYFRGADEPEKIKSIAPEFGYIGILWFEELDQFNGEEEVRNITQSAIRGGELAWIFKSFNPPRTTLNWANKYIKIPKDNMLVHHSNYMDVPVEWLGEPFIEEAEHLKSINPEAYEHEYLGVPNGTGGAVFENLEIRQITDKEISHFDRIYNGVDWGYFPDYYAFTRCAYVSSSDTVYIFAENCVLKQSNRQTAEWIINNGYNDYRITCDSAEPKSVNDYRDMGLPAVGAIKGAGSVEYSFKWLQSRHIVIDPVRCPKATDEFANYEYERDKEGNVISGYPDKNNHCIDSVRYALEQYWTRRGNQA